MVRKSVILWVWSQRMVWSGGYDPEIYMIQVFRIINSHDHVSMISAISMIHDFFDFCPWSLMAVWNSNFQVKIRLFKVSNFKKSILSKIKYLWIKISPGRTLTWKVMRGKPPPGEYITADCHQLNVNFEYILFVIVRKRVSPWNFHSRKIETGAYIYLLQFRLCWERQWTWEQKRVKRIQFIRAYYKNPVRKTKS